MKIQTIDKASKLNDWKVYCFYIKGEDKVFVSNNYGDYVKRQLKRSTISTYSSIPQTILFRRRDADIQ